MRHYNEIVIEKITSLDDLNARLWAWLDCVYHQAPHAGLLGKKPIERWREDLVHVRALGFKAEKIDGIFCHREIRLVRKDGSVSWNGKKFEVDFSLVGKEITLIVDPHAKTLLRAESASGDYLCLVTPLNEQANLNRKRYRPEKIISNAPEREKNLVEQVFDEHQKSLAIPEKNELTGE